MHFLDKYVTADGALYCMIAFVVIQNLFEVYLLYRQLNVYVNTKEVPVELKNVYTPELLNTVRLYGEKQIRFRIVHTLTMELTIEVLVLLFGILATIWSWSIALTRFCGFAYTNEIILSGVYIFLVCGIYYTLETLFEIYLQFVLEANYGRREYTVLSFVILRIMEFVFVQAIMVMLAIMIVTISLRAGDFFFLYLWLLMVVITFVIYGVLRLISIYSGKCIPLEEGPLKESIKKLTSSVNFPANRLCIKKVSDQSTHSNAYLEGACCDKRIVIHDTLLLNRGKKDVSELKEEERGKGCTDEEVLAVLAHELGHWKFNHTIKILVIGLLQLFLLCTIIGYLIKFAALYEAVGFEPGVRPVIVGFLASGYLIIPYIMITDFLNTMLSRRFEYQADKFAHSLGLSEKLGTALIKIHADNLVFPIDDWLYSAFNDTHPTLLQRLRRLKKLDEIQNPKSKAK